VRVTAVYEEVEEWGQNGLLPYGFRVWRPHAANLEGILLGAYTLFNSRLWRNDDGTGGSTITRGFTVLAVRVNGGTVYAPPRDRPLT
jgi:hypothetical protein